MLIFYVFLELNTIDRSLFAGSSSSVVVDPRKLELVITSNSLSLNEPGKNTRSIILNHDLATVSFAAAGDPQSSSATYVAYLANSNDSSGGPAARLGRWCYVLECPGHPNTASEVVAAIGHAFELRYRQHQRQRQSSEAHEHPHLSHSPSSPLAAGSGARPPHGAHEPSRLAVAPSVDSAFPFSAHSASGAVAGAGAIVSAIGVPQHLHHPSYLPPPAPSEAAAAVSAAAELATSHRTAAIESQSGVAQSGDLSGRRTSTCL